ncbi:MAG: hypothetical protein ACR2LJ_01935 [Acidimicrobiales bacterium]
MFKRIFWLSVGLVIGFGTSFWFFRLVRETMSRYAPEQVADNLAGAARRLGADLRAAVAEGRAAARQTEAELRAGHLGS